MPENKIKYGLKNVYYALATIADNGSATYETPVAFPGAVSLSLDPQGENVIFYADDIAYWVGNGNNGYSGDLEMARVIDAFKEDVLGMYEDSKKVFFEDVNAEPKHFALLFEFSGDKNHTRHVMYNCVATRPSAASQTKGETIEPQTESVTITALPVWNATLSKWITKAETKQDTDTTTYNAWTTAVYQGTAS